MEWVQKAVAEAEIDADRLHGGVRSREDRRPVGARRHDALRRPRGPAEGRARRARAERAPLRRQRLVRHDRGRLGGNRRRLSTSSRAFSAAPSPTARRATWSTTGPPRRRSRRPTDVLNPSTDERGRALQLATIRRGRGPRRRGGARSAGPVAKDEHDAGAWYQLGEIASRRGNLKEAATAFGRASGEAGAQGANAFYNLACALARAGASDGRARRPSRRRSKSGSSRRAFRRAGHGPRIAPRQTAVRGDPRLHGPEGLTNPVRNSGVRGSPSASRRPPSPARERPSQLACWRERRTHSLTTRSRAVDRSGRFGRRSAMRHSRCALSLVVLVIAFCVAPARPSRRPRVTSRARSPTRTARRCPACRSSCRSPQLQGTRTAVTDDAGRFRFPVLAPGVYSVTAQLSGFTKVERSNLKVALGATTTHSDHDGALRQGRDRRDVGGAGRRHVEDDDRDDASLEIASRGFRSGGTSSSIASTVAGTGTDVSGNVTVYGATGLENAVHHRRRQHDGRQDGHAGQAAQQRVHPGGRGQDRRLRGRVRPRPRRHDQRRHEVGRQRVPRRRLRLLRLGPPRRRATRTARPRGAANQGEYFSPKRVDFGADLGGYFVKDRLWFFGAYDRVNQDQDYTRTLAVAPRRGPRRTVSEQPRTADTYRNNLYSGKLTFRLGESNTIAASRSSAIRARSAAGTTSRRSRSWSAPTRAWLVDRNVGGTDFSAALGRHLRHAVPRAGPVRLPHREDGRTRARSRRLALPREAAGRLHDGGAPGHRPDLPRGREVPALRLQGRAARSSWAAHEIKAGLDWEHLNSDFSESLRRHGPHPDAPDGRGRRSTTTSTATSPRRRSPARTASGTIDPSRAGGVPELHGLHDRADRRQQPDHGQRRPLRAGLVQGPEEPHDQRRNPLRDSRRLKDYTGDDARQDRRTSGRRASASSGTSSATGGRSSTRTYGRFYEVDPAGHPDPRARQRVHHLRPQRRARRRIPSTSSSARPSCRAASSIQDDLKGMYQDEIIAGVEFEVAKNWAIGVKGIYRSLGRVVEDRCDLAINPDIAQLLQPGEPRDVRAHQPRPGQLARTRSRTRPTRRAIRTARRTRTATSSRRRRATPRSRAATSAASRSRRRTASRTTSTCSRPTSTRSSRATTRATSRRRAKAARRTRTSTPTSTTRASSRTPSAGSATTARIRSSSPATTRSRSASRWARTPSTTRAARTRSAAARRTRSPAPPATARRATSCRAARRATFPPRTRPTCTSNTACASDSVSVTPIARRLQRPEPAGRPEPRGALQQHGRLFAGNDPRSGIGQPGCTAQNASLDERGVRLEPHVRKGHRLAEPAGRASRRPRVLLRSRETS